MDSNHDDSKMIEKSTLFDISPKDIIVLKETKTLKMELILEIQENEYL